MIITDFLEKNARLYGQETALVELSPFEERDKAVTWWEFNLLSNTFFLEKLPKKKPE